MTGKAAATAYLSFLRENDCGDSGMLQHVALDMLGRPRSESLMGQAVGFFSHLGNILRQFAPLLDIEEDDDQIRAMFRRGLNMNGPRTAAYIKELRTEASLDEQFVWTVSSLSARGLAILKRIMTHLENQPPGTPPVTKEQIVGWLREGGASEDEVYLCLKEMGAA